MAGYTFSVRSASGVTNSNPNNQPPSPAIPPPPPPQQPLRAYPLGLKHSIPNPIPNPYPCPYCDRCFNCPQALGGHQNAHRKRRHVPIVISDDEDEAARRPPSRVPGRQTYENRLNYLMNPNPGNGSVGPYEPTDEEKFNMWRNAPSYYFYKYHYDNEIDYNTTRYFKNSYLRKNNIHPNGSSITAESNNGGNGNANNDANEVSSRPIVLIDLSRSP